MPLTYLLAAVPHWFAVTDTTPAEILGSTSLRLDNAVGVIEADLRIHEANKKVAVQEQFPGTRFPKTCHERHLQWDEHFCIGLEAGNGILSHDHAVVWWGLLERFLLLQRVAERTRRWPPQQELAHGDAGPHQIAAIEAAKELGLENEYMEMLAGGTPWFSNSGLQINPRGKLKNGWLACPVGCQRNGRAISRAACCRPAAVVKLITHERLRRQKTKEFYDSARASGQKCCGTMIACGLRDISSSGVSISRI